MKGAGIAVSGGGSRGAGHHRQTSFPNLFFDPFGMVNHFELTVELPVLVFQGVIAVRAGCNDFFNAESLPGFDILHGEGLVKVFLTDTPRRITAAFFFFAEDAEIELRLLEQSREGLGYFDVSFVERA